MRAAESYREAYGLADGAVFSSVLLVALPPENNSFRQGFEDGAEEGLDAAIVKAEACMGKRRAVIGGEEERAFDDKEPAPAPKNKALRATK